MQKEKLLCQQISQEKRAKKLVLVLDTFILMNIVKKKICKNDENGKYLETNLARVLYIWYPIIFWKKFMLALFDWESVINIIHLIFTKELGFLIWLTNVRVQKIDIAILNAYEMVVIAFLITDQTNWVKLFEKIFLVANISLKVVFEIFFFILSSVNIDFLGKK